MKELIKELKHKKEINKRDKMKKDKKQYVLKINEMLYIKNLLGEKKWGCEFTDVKKLAGKFNYKDAEHECDSHGFTMEEV